MKPGDDWTTHRIVCKPSSWTCTMCDKILCIHANFWYYKVGNFCTLVSNNLEYTMDSTLFFVGNSRSHMITTILEHSFERICGLLYMFTTSSTSTSALWKHCKRGMLRGYSLRQIFLCYSSPPSPHSVCLYCENSILNQVHKNYMKVSTIVCWIH